LRPLDGRNHATALFFNAETQRRGVKEEGGRKKEGESINAETQRRGDAENERRTPKFSLSALLSSAFSPPPFSFLLSPFSFLLPPSLLRPLRGRNHAFTLIELVAALSLFVVILGILMTVLNSATEMWSASRSQKKEQTAALAITDLIADDLYQAVADNSVPTNSTANAPEYSSFILETPPANATLNDVVVLLAFARRSSSRVPDPDTAGATDTRFSLDAVFYTYYLNALFRHVIPLYNDFTDPQPLGTLLHDLRDSVKKENIHKQIIESLSDATKSSDAKWQYTLLAERVLPSLNATIPEGFVRQKDQGFPHMVEGSDKWPIGNNMKLHPIFDRLTTDVLPDQIDVAFRLFDEQDWAAYWKLEKDSSPADVLKSSYLGTFISRRITLPQAGGSRLP
jgi:type II secretory pathway pseudopilin PulG